MSPTAALSSEALRSCVRMVLQSSRAPRRPRPAVCERTSIGADETAQCKERNEDACSISKDSDASLDCDEGATASSIIGLRVMSVSDEGSGWELLFSQRGGGMFRGDFDEMDENEPEGRSGRGSAVLRLWVLVPGGTLKGHRTTTSVIIITQALLLHAIDLPRSSISSVGRRSSKRRNGLNKLSAPEAGKCSRKKRSSSHSTTFGGRIGLLLRLNNTDNNSSFLRNPLHRVGKALPCVSLRGNQNPLRMVDGVTTVHRSPPPCKNRGHIPPPLFPP